MVGIHRAVVLTIAILVINVTGISFRIHPRRPINLELSGSSGRSSGRSSVRLLIKVIRSGLLVRLGFITVKSTQPIKGATVGALVGTSLGASVSVDGVDGAEDGGGVGESVCGVDGLSVGGVDVGVGVGAGVGDVSVGGDVGELVGGLVGLLVGVLLGSTSLKDIRATAPMFLIRVIRVIRGY